ncbi:MAG TPA: hypothetical protein VG166_02455 [Caulobacteraceae bacterium]|jgi:hypothetical protein|nr:hypothetical protein [Caulobacteraceae bacterium]
MQTTTLIIIGLVVVAVLVIGFLVYRRQSSARLKSNFGPEYDRVVEEIGAKSKAEAQLHDREKRVKKFDLKPLTPTDRERFTERWRHVQAQFVDDPGRALADADTLLGEVMSVRGYPVADFDQQSADLSVDHPVVVQSYRDAHAMAVRESGGDVGTEDRRGAMLNYRRLFDELVADPASDQPRTEKEKAEAHE